MKQTTTLNYTELKKEHKEIAKKLNNQLWKNKGK